MGHDGAVGGEPVTQVHPRTTLVLILPPEPSGLGRMLRERVGATSDEKDEKTPVDPLACFPVYFYSFAGLLHIYFAFIPRNTAALCEDKL